MAKGRRKKRRSKKKRKASKGKIPLKILEKRLKKLNNTVADRGGTAFYKP